MSGSRSVGKKRTTRGRRPVPLRVPIAPSLPAVLAIVGAAAFWGTSFVAARAVLQDVPPITLAFLRFAIAAAVLLPATARCGHRPDFGPGPAVLGLTGIALFFLCQNV